MDKINLLNDVNPFVFACLDFRKKHPQGFAYDRRILKVYELYLILSTDGKILINDQQLSVKRGDLLLLHPGTIIEGITPLHLSVILFGMIYNGQDSRIEPKSIEETEVVDYRNICPPGYIGFPFDFPTILHTKNANELERLFLKSYDEFLHFREETRFYMKMYLFQILGIMLTELSSTNFLQSPNRYLRTNYPKIMEVKEYIDNNIYSKLSLDKLADLVSLSPSFMGRLFKEIVGFSPITYINESRIKLVKKLLVESDKSIKEIALECGYDNYTYFFTLFKKHEGLSPINYRENVKSHFN